MDGGSLHREETYRGALARIIDAHHALPIAALWGDGTTSSSDGQFFRSGKRGAGGGEVNARYGVDPGFSFYTHVSDQHGPYHVRVISAATHEAPYVLDGLLHHSSSLVLAEHYTDTGGATDHVFALCALLGFRFCPRLRDFPDRRLVSIAAPSVYPYLASLLGKKVRTDVIREHWGEILRLVASLNAGHVAPSTMLRKLAATSGRTSSTSPSRKSARWSARCSCWTGWRTPTCAAAVTPGSTRASSAMP